MPDNSLDITPSVSVIGHFRNQDYDPWGALAEYVDNSLDSYLKNKDRLKEIDGDDYQLKVVIIFNEKNNEILIRDNAAGISESRVVDAFKTAEPPPDNSGLSEFGVGMKAASTWWCDLWEVTSTALDENIERIVRFDIPNIIKTKTEELKIETTERKTSQHYTLITLNKIHSFPSSSTIKKIKEHLASIYRYFIERGEIELVVENKNKREILCFKMPPTLYAPYFEDPSGSEKKLWRKEIDFKFQSKQTNKKFRVHGYVGILEKMGYKYNGFTLLRRGRVIEGNQGDDVTFKPKFMGSKNGFTYRRLFGELHLEGFEVTFNKGKFKSDDYFKKFIHILKEKLDEDKDLPILLQCEGYRAKATKKELEELAKESVEAVTKINKEEIQDDLMFVETHPEEDIVDQVSDNAKTYWETFDLNFHGAKWTVYVECSYDDNITELFEVGTHFLPNDKRRPNTVGIRLSLLHEYMQNFAGTDKKTVQAILRFIVSMGLTEALHEELGNQEFTAHSFRKSINDLLSKSLSRIR